MLQLNYRDPRPIYEQVKSEFRRLILSGALPRGEKLPSVRELAYRALEAEGYLLSMPGKGSFVADATDLERQKRLDAEHALRAAAQSLAALGYGPDKLDALWAQMREELEP